MAGIDFPLLPWDASPLNARFIAALYAMGALSALLCLLAQRYTEVRITLIQIGLVTLLLLLITIPRLGEFAPPRSFPLGWVLSYTIDPLLAALLLWQMRRLDHTPAGHHPLSLVLFIYAVVLGVLGDGAACASSPRSTAMADGSCQQCWGSSTARSFSVWRCARCSRRASRAAEGSDHAIAQLFLLLLVVVVSLLHIDRFRAGPATWLWFAFCLIGAAAFATVLLRRSGQPALRGSSI